jgi:hypothetical protein
MIYLLLIYRLISILIKNFKYRIDTKFITAGLKRQTVAFLWQCTFGKGLSLPGLSGGASQTGVLKTGVIGSA